MQQISPQQVVHIVLSLPLNTSSRNCVFINTLSSDKRAFILKKKKELQQEKDESEDKICPSIIDYYMRPPEVINGICLA